MYDDSTPQQATVTHQDAITGALALETMQWTQEQCEAAQRADNEAERYQQYRLYDVLYMRYRYRQFQSHSRLNNIARRAKEKAHDYLVTLPDEVFTESRSQHVIGMKKKAIRELRESFNFSFPIIAKLLGYKDHTGILHHYNQTLKERFPS